MTTTRIEASLKHTLRLAEGYLKMSSPEVFNFSVGIVVLSLLFQLWRLCKKRDTGKPVVPGRFGLPLIGETFEYMRSIRANKAHEFLEPRVKKYGDVFKTCLFGNPVVMALSPAGNKLVFTNENKLVHMAWPQSVIDTVGSRSLIALRGDKAKKMKQAITTFLRPEALQMYTGQADVSTRRFLEQFWEGKEQVTVLPLMKGFIFSLACELLVSQYKKEEQQMLEKPFTIMMKHLFTFPINLPGTNYRKARNATNLVRNHLKRWLDDRRKDLDQGNVARDQDLLTCLLSYKDDEGKPLEEQDLLDNVLLVLFASYDTSSAMMTMVCKLLAENPAVLEDVWKEQKQIVAGKKPGEPLNWGDLQRMKLSWRVVQETLRIHPPVQGTLREAIKDFEFSGFIIPKSWKIYWTVNSTHWNPKYFPEPHKFDPSRFEGAGPQPYTFVPFGGGSRMCPGNEYARMLALILLHNLVLRFKWKLVDPDETIRIEPSPRPQKGLPIWLQRRTD